MKTLIISKNAKGAIAAALVYGLSSLGIAQTVPVQNQDVSQEQTPEKESQRNTEQDSLSKDSQILNVLVNLNNSEILTGRLAKQKAKNDEVRAFADEMVDQHSQANQAIEKLKKVLRINTESTDFSEHFKKAAAEQMAKLKMVRIQLFDSHYIEAQVVTLKQAMKMIDENLIPKAKNPKLILLLNQAKEIMHKQADEATKLQQNIQSQTIEKQ